MELNRLIGLFGFCIILVRGYDRQNCDVWRNVVLTGMYSLLQLTNAHPTRAATLTCPTNITGSEYVGPGRKI